MSINLLCTFGLRTLAKSFQIFWEMRLDIICISEDCRIDCCKSMADTCLIFKCTAFIRSNTHRKNRTENLTEHSISITFMASIHFFISTKWHNSAAFFANNICKYSRCIRTFMSVCSESPALRKLFTWFIIHFQFSSGYNCCRAVKEKRIWLCRHRYCDRVGT